MSVWSPDDKKIAFVSDRDGTGDLRHECDGSNASRLDGRGWHSATWSPDGARIAFETDRDGNSEVLRDERRRLESVNLTRNFASDGFPAWSPARQDRLSQRRDGTAKSI